MVAGPEQYYVQNPQNFPSYVTSITQNFAVKHDRAAAAIRVLCVPDLQVQYWTTD